MTGRAPAWREERAQRRQSLGVLALLVWLIGHEVGPDLHLALHDAIGAHEHGAPSRGRVERTARAKRAHAHDHQHVAGWAHDHDHRPRDGRDLERPAPPGTDHGAGSAAHRDQAIHPAAPPITAPAPVDPPSILLAAPRLADGAWRPQIVTAARGPPDRPLAV